MEKPAVIYLFTSPSGRAYAGRHTCDPEGWPRRGTGRLPDGYEGSGKLWASVTRRHGPVIRWAILRRFPAGTPRTTVDAAERRAIRIVRAIWGERCANVHEGGTGHTSADALAMWQDAGIQERHRAAMIETYADPVRRAAISDRSRSLWRDPAYRDVQQAALKDAHGKPEVRERHRQTSLAVWADPEGRARALSALNALKAQERKSEALRAAWSDPEAKARWTAAQRRSSERPEAKARHAAATREAANRPDVKAKNAARTKAWAATPEGKAHLARASCIRRINDGWRRWALDNPHLVEAENT